mmetsp:Transcript_27495/g.80844  ORF Transcript_27495/g.80844 Transcript_27495/m.80844 type:complete len:375 (+) Transcript_27495:400-1524(+)
MEPHVDAHLGARLWWERLVVCHRLVDVEVRVRHRRPEDGCALARLVGDSEVREARAATRLDIVGVHEEGEEPDSLGRPVSAVLVVVHLIELAGFVVHDLRVLHVGLADAGERGETRGEGLDMWVVDAGLRGAPALRGRAHGGHLVASHAAREGVVAVPEDGVDLLVPEEIVEGEDPRVPVEHLWAVLGEVGEGSLEEGVEAAGLLRDGAGALRPVAGGFALLAGSAGHRTRPAHVLWVVLALARGRPRPAARAFVLTRLVLVLAGRAGFGQIGFLRRRASLAAAPAGIQHEAWVGRAFALDCPRDALLVRIHAVSGQGGHFCFESVHSLVALIYHSLSLAHGFLHGRILQGILNGRVLVPLSGRVPLSRGSAIP